MFFQSEIELSGECTTALAMCSYKPVFLISLTTLFLDGFSEKLLFSEYPSSKNFDFHGPKQWMYWLENKNNFGTN